jgi:hypothetical protein
MRVTFGNFDSMRSYSIMALQQARLRLDSDANEEQQLNSREDRFSLGIAATQDRFETAKPENTLFRFWLHR